MKHRAAVVFLCGAIVFSLLSAASAQQQAAAVPDGPSSLREVYQDWSVACSVQENVNNCSLSHDQVQQNGQRLLAVEMQRRADGSATATLLLPFGILLDPGVAPQIDDQSPLPSLRFRTCLPTGCVAVFSIDPSTLGKMREGSVLKLNVTTAAETQLTFPVSLRGLPAALDRMAALSAR
jgi:invasion protein IalB